MIDCTECRGTGTAEMIGGYSRPCDSCFGKGELPAMTDTPTQEDKNAAADLIEAYWPHDEQMQRLARSYRCGHTGGIWAFAFAAHRLASTAALQAENERLRARGDRLLRALEGRRVLHVETIVRSNSTNFTEVPDRILANRAALQETDNAG